jgi:tetrapyrrole methylase family protein / MazG family protein
VGSVLVVGLSGTSPGDDWDLLLAGRTVVVRNAAVARAVTPPACTFDHAFDDIVDSPDVATIAQRITDQIQSLAQSEDVAYLVPGLGVLGDCTVHRLSQHVAVQVRPGLFGTLTAPGASIRFIDALELAEAEQQRPFDAGLAPLDSSVRTHVTSFAGQHVKRLAGERIMRTYAVNSAYVQPDPDHAVVLDAKDAPGAGSSLSGFLEIVARLRRPDGCPWDREQTASSMLADFQEEVGEVIAAVDSCDWGNLAEELGDVLLHVAMQAQIAAEEERFSFDDVVSGVAAKLVRRHPHVFGDVSVTSAKEVLSVWRRVKQEEKTAQQRDES